MSVRYGYQMGMTDKKQDKSASNTRMPVQRRDDDSVNEDGSPVVAPAFDGWPDSDTKSGRKAKKGADHASNPNNEGGE